MRDAGRCRCSVAVSLLVAVTIVSIGPPRLAMRGLAGGGCPPHGPVVCVDRADGGHTVHVRVGQVLKVVLAGTTLRWSGLREVGPALLRRPERSRPATGGSWRRTPRSKPAARH